MNPCVCFRCVSVISKTVCDPFCYESGPFEPHLGEIQETWSCTVDDIIPNLVDLRENREVAQTHLSTLGYSGVLRSNTQKFKGSQFKKINKLKTVKQNKNALRQQKSQFIGQVHSEVPY